MRYAVAINFVGAEQDGLQEQVGIESLAAEEDHHRAHKRASDSERRAWATDRRVHTSAGV